jgi:hypothetical protein
MKVPASYVRVVFLSYGRSFEAQRGVGKSSHHPDAKVANSHRSPVLRRFV